MPQAQPPKTDFAMRLDAALAAAGVSMNQLERAIGAPDGYVSRLRTRGAQRIEPRTLFAIADELGVDGRWLFTGAGSAAGSPAAVAPTADATRLRERVASLEEALHAVETTCRGALRRAR